MKARYTQRVDGEAFTVPSGELCRIACCDCGLVHDMVFVSEDSKPIGVAARVKPVHRAEASQHARLHRKACGMTATTILIVPAWSDQAGQCRIVARDHDDSFTPGLADYRRQPDLWRDAGLMNSQGRLVCLDAERDRYADIQSCEPLMAGSVFTYPQLTQEQLP
jgi:hypothetical protein